MARTWVRLREQDAFAATAAEVLQRNDTNPKQPGSLRDILRTLLRVHSNCIAMVMARDLEILVPDLVSASDVSNCTVVGGGARALVAEFATETCRQSVCSRKGRLPTDIEQLQEIHSQLELRVRSCARDADVSIP